MKRHRGKIVLVLLLLALVGSFTLRDAAARAYLRLNSQKMEEFAREALVGETEADHYGPWRVSVWREKKIVEFHTWQSPATGGNERGFYYSANNTPVSFQATGYPLATDGAGWRWADPYGNYGYTERILANWFWFDAVL
ncbi:MAG: hypothetical protein K2O84_11005 [Oscillospiraceae bacterium]|jgi:hypothetical protein|nr:hypothetical protein [Oscillospiraceae bacterium]